MTLSRRDVSDLLTRDGIHPSRALGQNFVDPNTVRRATPTTRPAPKPAPTTTTQPKPAHDITGGASWYDAPTGTCAMRDAPKGTVVHVTNLANGKSTTCTVSDYGPTMQSRVIDLSKGNFAQIADPAQGVIQVRVTW